MKFWDLHFKKDVEKLVRRGLTKMIKGMEDKLDKESLRKLDIFSLDKRRLGWGGMIAIFKYLKQ